MARVFTAKKSTRGKKIQCGRCSIPIKPGESYYYFFKRFSRMARAPKSIRCMQHRPRQSELTTSKLSTVYAAQEAAEDSIAVAEEPDDIAQALRDCAQGVEDCRDEYQESLDNMPEGLQQGSTGEEIQEKIDALDTYASSLEDAASEIDGESLDDETGECNTCKGEENLCPVCSGPPSTCLVLTPSKDLAALKKLTKKDRAKHVEQTCSDCEGSGLGKAGDEKLEELKEQAREAVGGLEL